MSDPFAPPAPSNIALPVCGAGAGHLSRGRFKALLIALSGGLGGVLCLVGLLAMANDAGPYALIVGVCGVATAVFSHQFGTWRHVHRARSGHHTMFAMWVGPGFTSVRTTNRLLAEHLRKPHASIATVTEQRR
ncbi:MAG: hypothetical protein EP330_21620 [Deltaproteobacteria bacterium]|nr:MAG: hypothetical protein EP330_21620 [Deltaproteobacteria bacterium]